MVPDDPESTVTVIAALLPAVNSPSLLVKVAEMLCVPTARDEVVMAAVYGELLDRVMVPMDVVPSENVTVPSGPCALGSCGVDGVTVTVKVTGWPTFTVVAEAASATAVVSAVTACVTVLEVPPV
jgi:hypothetical protein